MDILLKLLIGAAAVAFFIAVFGSIFNIDLLGVDPEGYSRASNNIALIAIAISLKKA